MFFEFKFVFCLAVSSFPNYQNDVIIKQKDIGDFFYIIEEGLCEVFVDGVGKVMDAKEGQSFGELALMYNAPRAATVVRT